MSMARRPGPQRKVSGGRWQKTRVRILKRDHSMCQPCAKRGKVVLATQVDHVIPLSKGGTDDDSNLQAICERCHDRKTRKELGRKGSGACDANGLPLDPSHPWHQS
jgi:5-methylcytosine-specific restriction endonuclease McrA